MVEVENLDPARAAEEASEAFARRRTEPRVTAAFRVTFRELDQLVEAYTTDVSKGGLYVATDHELPQGAVVRLLVQLPEGGPELRAVARVAYCLDESAARTHNRKPGMGMQFLDIGGMPLADEISRYVTAVAPETDMPLAPAAMLAHVLVVDDDVGHRDRAANVMRELGFEVTTANNGVQGLQTALQIEPDLVLTDVQMPIMDGWQFVRMLRARPGLESMPVIFVTSLSSDEERLQGYRLGVDDYIAKPFEPDELSLRVQRALSRARAYPRSPTTSSALRGILSQVSLSTLLSFCDIERRTGVLLLVKADEVATVFLRGGDAIRVELADEHDHLEGAARIHYLLGWTDARFELAGAEVEGDNTIGKRTAHILLDYAEKQIQRG